MLQKNIFSAPLFYLIVCVCACAPKPHSYTRSIDAGENIDLKLGEPVKLKGKNITIEFIDIPEDSRCPLYVDCVWAGQVVVSAVIEADGKREERQFTKKGKEAKPATASVGNYTIHLLEVNPYPESEEKIEKKNYRIQIRID